MEIFYGNYENYYDLDDTTSALVAQVQAWQEALFEQLKELYPGLTNYVSSESSTFAYISDLHYGALLLTLVYHEAKKPVPQKMKNMWMEDKVFVQAVKAGSKSKYHFLIDLPEILVPLELDITFQYVDLENEERSFGSLYQLRNLLTKINDTYFNIEDFQQETTQPEQATTLEMARHTLAQLFIICNDAIEKNAILRIE